MTRKQLVGTFIALSHRVLLHLQVCGDALLIVRSMSGVLTYRTAAVP